MGLFDAIGSILGTDKSGQAIDAQSAATAQANETLKQMYNQQREDLSPYREAGTTALSGMQDPNFQKSFTMADFNADPGYQFRLQEGQKALERSAAARGGLMGGATLKALTNYGQGAGAQEYQAAYDRFNNDQNTRFGRLSTISGMGLNAAGQTANAAQNYGNQVSANQIGLGNAQAGAYMGQAANNAGMLNGIIGAGTSLIGSGMTSRAITDAAKIRANAGNPNPIYACDLRLKKDIEEVSQKDLAELRASVKPFLFKYKDPEKWGEGEVIGPMAQDLEKSRLGRTLVKVDDAGNKLLDLSRVYLLLLATIGAE
jgi:hypothetical protein